ncbi:MAG: peptidase M50 [Brevundimonas sp.]|uniref:metalloprotease n=1 Tax=Brevundimonas sp. TaxID=1871086 RepID=UPI00271F8F5D|nr:site-2 protease family protein [Brevundimonas sp.]MDO9587186.1 peptidase M50 [Brevundimonas sp.]MDP3369509.1 peptidase M50 [Brevundimonas sp.]MDP3657172.1 peptidase M50 [Brevundimonas sp.]MDZ4112909.1 peptidase M50 [Brevundimonas sp.]
MTETNTPRRPGPWDPKPEQAASARDAAAAELAPARGAEAPLDKGQNPVWAVISTLLLGGFIWWISQSWVIAVAAIWGLLVHEYGHVLAMNRLGMGPAKIYIIPFLGGVAKSQRLPKSEWDGVLVSLAGPGFGLLAAIPFFAGFIATGQGMWLLGAAVIALINLVNLAPAPPLDGSRALGPVLARIHPNVERGAMVLIGALVVFWGLTTGRFILAAFLALALIGHLRRGAWRPEGRPLTGREAGQSVGLFLVAAIACAGVGVAALMPLAGGSLPGALAIAGGYLGIGG